MCMGPLLTDSAVQCYTHVTNEHSAHPVIPHRPKAAPAAAGTGTFEFYPPYKGQRGYKAVFKRSPAFQDFGITQNMLNHFFFLAIKIPLLQLLQFHLLDHQGLSIPVSYKKIKKLYLYMYTQRALPLLLLK